jgi:hypothetical protein
MTAAPTPLRALRDAEPPPALPDPDLVAEVARIGTLLEGYRTGAPAGPVPGPRAAGVARLAALFGLSPFETDLLVLTAAVELDGQVAARCARAVGGPGAADPRPTFGLALAVLPDAHWDALSPERPLRRWGLVEVGPGATLATRPLSIDETVLHEITGIAPGAGALHGVARFLDDAAALAPSQAVAVEEVAGAVVAGGGRVLVRVVAEDEETARAAAQRLTARLGRTALLVRADGIPAGSERAGLARHVDRAALFAGAVPVLASGDATLAEDLEARVVVALGDGPAVPGRLSLRRALALPEPPEQRLLWRAALGLGGGDGDGDGDPEGAGDAVPSGDLARAVDEVAQHYRFGPATLDGIARELRGLSLGAAEAPDRLRALCRERARVGLDGLAERIDLRARWDDLVLPPGQVALLRDLVHHVRHRGTVHERWGFAGAANRGLGVTALFSGESGTGKTMAAEVIAGDLGLDLYRIDLAAVVSKYIGETEKNLRTVFAAAEASGAVLLFDEADALFGKRGEVRDGHDRYANLEVSYLLQRMETYRGLAILTTNLRSNVDKAFLRRLRFVVQFPFPDEGLRAAIWARAFPAATPTEGLEPAALARLQVPGGSIRSIAVGAAFAAAAAGEPVRPGHVLHAARVEYAKAERALTDAETTALARGAR